MRTVWVALLGIMMLAVVAAAQDAILDRLDAIDLELDGISFTLNSVSARVDDLKTNVDFVGSQVGDMWAAMNNAFDWVDGRFATIEANLWPTIAKIDDLKTNVDFVGSQISGMWAAMNNAFDGVDGRFATIEANLWPTIAKIDDLKTNVDFVGSQVSGMWAAMNASVDHMGDRVTILDDKLNTTLSQMDWQGSVLTELRGSVNGLGQQLSTEHDELASAITDGTGNIVELILDFGPALVQMNQGQLAKLDELWLDLATSIDGVHYAMMDAHSNLIGFLGEELGYVHEAIWAASLEARQTTWNAADYLEGKINAGFAAVDTQFSEVEATLATMDAKLDQLLECCGNMGGYEGKLDRVIELLEYLIDTIPPGWDKKAAD